MHDIKYRAVDLWFFWNWCTDIVLLTAWITFVKDLCMSILAFNGALSLVIPGSQYHFYHEYVLVHEIPTFPKPTSRRHAKVIKVAFLA